MKKLTRRSTQSMQLSAALALAFAATPGFAAGVAHELTGWASLPSTARLAGQTSGQFITPGFGTPTPYVDGQPIPGWSALLKNSDGTWLAMPDNGYGSKGNSGDYVIGFFNTTIDFRTVGNGTTTPGSVTNNGYVAFNDARGLLKNGVGVDLAITADFNNYHTVSGNTLVDSGIAVASDIRTQRKLTGFDFDVESIARAKDGSYWVGEEFGPYLLHFDANGTLIEEPIAHPFLKSPSHPDVMNNGATVTSRGSRGFEALAFNGDSSRLYAVPEAAPSVTSLQPVPGDERVLNFFEFDPATSSYTGNNAMYEKDGPMTGNNIVIGDMANVVDNRFVLIERDSLYGANAVVKRIYLVDLDVVDERGILEKRLLVDLLDISDPRDIGGDLAGLDPLKFSMPFDSIESIVVLDDHTLAIAIDTNYPSEDGRLPGIADDTEVITLRFEQSLATMPVPEPSTYALMALGLGAVAAVARKRRLR